MSTLAALSEQLARGATTARTLVEEAWERIADPAGEGCRSFIQVSIDAARAQADQIDRWRAAGATLPPYAGIPIGIKDLFDVAGEVTRAGSRLLEDSPAADRDAPAVARLRAAGFIMIGRTNMTEFAYSGVGLNPHYGTPLNPFDRETGRIPGGSTSGGAVAVADGMVAASLGTDTGGSCRIPAALTGITGFKPTARRVPLEGTIPLSPSLDSVGPLARSVACCATLDAILRDAPEHSRGQSPGRAAQAPLRPPGQSLAQPPGRTLERSTGQSLERSHAPSQPAVTVSDLRLLLPTTRVLDGMDSIVARAFERAVDQLARAGATIRHAALPEFAAIPKTNASGGLAAAEAYAWHRPHLERHADRYDPRVASRILKGKEFSAEDVRRMHQARQQLIESFNAATQEFQALLMPTVPIVAPPLSAFALDEDYARLNMLMLRNPSLTNFLDGCGISLPIHAPGEAPVGLMLMGRHADDVQLLTLAAAIESALARSRPGAQPARC